MYVSECCYPAVQFEGVETFYRKITFLTPVTRSKVTVRSKSFDTIGQDQWSSGSSIIDIRHSLAELEAVKWLPERKKKKLVMPGHDTQDAMNLYLSFD